MDARPAVRRALEKEAKMQATLEAEGLAPKMG
jgi:predicted Ser/Thr protein kinase